MNIDDAAADGAETTPVDEPMPSARSRLKKTTARTAAAADEGDDAGENAAPAGEEEEEAPKKSLKKSTTGAAGKNRRKEKKNLREKRRSTGKIIYRLVQVYERISNRVTDIHNPYLVVQGYDISQQTP